MITNNYVFVALRFNHGHALYPQSKIVVLAHNRNKYISNLYKGNISKIEIIDPKDFFEKAKLADMENRVLLSLVEKMTMRKRQKHWLYRNIGKPFSRDIKEYAMMVFREEYEEFKKLKREKIAAGDMISRMLKYPPANKQNCGIKSFSWRFVREEKRGYFSGAADILCSCPICKNTTTIHVNGMHGEIKCEESGNTFDLLNLTAKKMPILRLRAGTAENQR